MLPYSHGIIRCDPLWSQVCEQTKENGEKKIHSREVLEFKCSECDVKYKAAIENAFRASGRCRDHAKRVSVRNRPRYSGIIPKYITRPIRAGLLQRIDHSSLLAIVAEQLQCNAFPNKDSSIKEAKLYIDSVVSDDFANNRIQLLDSGFWGDDCIQRKDGHRYKPPAKKETTSTGADASAPHRRKRRRCTDSPPLQRPEVSTTTIPPTPEDAPPLDEDDHTGTRCPAAAAAPRAPETPPQSSTATSPPNIAAKNDTAAQTDEMRTNSTGFVGGVGAPSAAASIAPPSAAAAAGAPSSPPLGAEGPSEVTELVPFAPSTATATYSAAALTPPSPNGRPPCTAPRENPDPPEQQEDKRRREEQRGDTDIPDTGTVSLAGRTRDPVPGRAVPWDPKRAWTASDAEANEHCVAFLRRIDFDVASHWSELAAWLGIPYPLGSHRLSTEHCKYCSDVFMKIACRAEDLLGQDDPREEILSRIGRMALRAKKCGYVPIHDVVRWVESGMH